MSLTLIIGNKNYSSWSLRGWLAAKQSGLHFEEIVVRYAKQHQADGIVCGHIHTPAIKRIHDTAYYNCGDWVESRTALVEHFDGRIELLHWDKIIDDAVPAGNVANELTTAVATLAA